MRYGLCRKTMGSVYYAVAVDCDLRSCLNYDYFYDKIIINCSLKKEQFLLRLRLSLVFWNKMRYGKWRWGLAERSWQTMPL
jgi:hypothetical protein